jgi:hypothetical protein
MITPEIREKSGTQLINVPVRIEHVSLSGQSGDWLQSCYPSSEFLKSFKNMVLSDLNSLNKKAIEVKLSDSSGQLGLVHEEVPSYFEKNLQVIKEAFLKEFLLKSKLIRNSANLISEVSNKIFKYIAELDFETGTVEITNSNSIKFTLLFPDNRLLLITKSIFPEKFDFNTDEVIFSFFINRKLVASDVSEIPVLTKGFKEYLAM